MTQGNYYDYKTGAIASLPSGMTYNSAIARFVVNGRNFFTYEDAKWYLDYIQKYGFNLNYVLFIPSGSDSLLTSTGNTFKVVE